MSLFKKEHKYTNCLCIQNVFKRNPLGNLCLSCFMDSFQLSVLVAKRSIFNLLDIFNRLHAHSSRSKLGSALHPG